MVGIICGIAFSKNDSKNMTTNTQKQEENTITNEETNNITNELAENEIEENSISENTQTTNTTQTQKTDKEKAIEIVKKDYGTTSTNIKFNAEGTDSNGRQIIVVRDLDTTAALQFYHVDVSTGTFIKE